MLSACNYCVSVKCVSFHLSASQCTIIMSTKAFLFYFSNFTLYNLISLETIWLMIIISKYLLFPQDFTLDFYFRQFWTDPRLAYKKRAGVEQLSVGSEFIKNIWVPDTFFVNEKQSYFHIATTSNEFIRIHHTGSITRSIRWGCLLLSLLINNAYCSKNPRSNFYCVLYLSILKSWQFVGDGAIIAIF